MALRWERQRTLLYNRWHNYNSTDELLDFRKWMMIKYFTPATFYEPFYLPSRLQSGQIKSIT
jgi:hypothetical protein